MHISLIILFTVFAKLCAASDSKIVGGKVITIEEAPYQVGLVRGRSYCFCGGSLISRNFVMTAAHCLFGNISNLYVRLGSSRSTEGGVLVKVIEATRHPNYTSYPIDYDFGILKLNESVELPSVAKPIQLADADDQCETGAMSVVSGFGKTKRPGDDPTLLRAVEVPVVDQNKCNVVYHNWVTDRMVCAGYTEGGKDSCQGDSGGPMVRLSDKVLVGVVSWGRGCALPNYPGVYSRISSVRGWINETAGI